MRLLARTLAGISLVVLSACHLNTDYFSQYRDRNLVANFAFADWTSPGAPTNLVFEDATAAGGTLPPGAVEAYRLETKNLWPNGDFEDGALTPDGTPADLTVGADGWSTDDTAATLTWATSHSVPDSGAATVAKGLSGRSLYWSAGNFGGNLTYDLTAQAGAVLTANQAYRLRFDFIPVSDMTILDLTLSATSTATTLDQFWLAQAGGDWTQAHLVRLDPYAMSAHFVWDGTARTLKFGPRPPASDKEAAIVDNFRLVLDDKTQLRALLTLNRLDSGVLPLLPGTKTGMYKFSIWVKDDPQALAGTGNHRPAQVVTLGAQGTVKSGVNNPLSQPFERPAAGWTAWTQLTWNLSFDFVQSNADLGTNPALVLQVAPANLTSGENGGVDAGSVLIALPSFVFDP